jgi:hypothetical protein
MGEATKKRKELDTAHGSRVWVVTVDSHPMPYEINKYPFKVVVGSEVFVSSIVEQLNKKKGQALFEYSECADPNIHFENAEIGQIEINL